MTSIAMPVESSGGAASAVAWWHRSTIAGGIRFSAFRFNRVEVVGAFLMALVAIVARQRCFGNFAMTDDS